MGNLNKWQGIGRFGKDPEAKYTPQGTMVVKVSLGISNKWTDKGGEKHDETDWVNLEFWGRLAEIVNEYLHKGSEVYVEGRLKTDKFEGSDGQTKYFTKVVVRELQMLGSKNGNKNGNSEPNVEEHYGDAADEHDPMGMDDIPF